MARTPCDAAELDVAGLEAALCGAADGEVRFDAGSRGAYATDGSNYRQMPIGVVVPRTVEAGAHAVQVCARFGAPVLSRGGGTSLAGQSTNTAVVIDWTKYCHALVSVDPGARTCVVEPGIVLDVLNQRLSDHQLHFAPKPSTHSHCTLGGMIGNNSCGASAQAYGKTVDNVRRLEVLTYDGTRMWVGPMSPRCGGITVWLRAAALAQARGIDISGHCAPTPTRTPLRLCPTCGTWSGSTTTFALSASSSTAASPPTVAASPRVPTAHPGSD